MATSIRWAALTGIVLLAARRWVYGRFPGVLPSSAWRPEWWWMGLLLSAGFELMLIAVLIGVPAGIYFFRLRAREINARELLIDCAGAVSLYVAALILL